ncbi:hypothetical protein CC1G_02471 [Coprinopsis cinerea okayama7|uniref:Tyrosinase copper-binding domain-containing protein n=1 Tax=Coprinopsis cinerea (strain Okayama-7 / 130 / ATCC MYA-4618 / FGSC 9003) TaxID=240176 RepID=A8NBL1_COPC7|nr:hypothetical protein CC1G_02471 [Coprinopsis cinerea okayama7\|eukprot:XP_001832209.1 hypothetical protein CC1G_02471 [Coprinopsis cinerea okayama7\
MALFTRFVILAVLLQSFTAIFAAPQDGDVEVQGRPGGGGPGGPKPPKCRKIEVRKEWRDLTKKQRRDYIRAVKCLQAKPSTAFNPPRPGVVSRYDEFQASHYDLAHHIHPVGQFLHWHRHFVTLYNKALKEECGYKGPATYWDWTRDADGPLPMASSPVFDNVEGFGGNGVPGTYTPPPNIPEFPGPDWPEDFPFPVPPPFPGTLNGPQGEVGCVQTGPFADQVVRLGPATLVMDRCLVRGIFEDVKDNLNSTVIAATLAQPTFDDFRLFLDVVGPPLEPNTGIHLAGHAVVGGLMVDGWSAPGDPLFYLHHGNLDRIWAKWQALDPNRLTEVSGTTTAWPPYTNLTLDFLMPFTTLSPPVAIKDVMNTEAWPNCYRYND